jgi:hypothetical protein
MASEFEGGVAPLAAELRELNSLAENFGRVMTTAFRRSVIDGRALEDVLRSIALSLSSRALNSALAPIGQGLFSGLLGGVFRQGALGQIGSPSTHSSMSSRNANAQRADVSHGGVNVVFNVTTPDAESFRRAEGEVTAMLARAVARGQRGL